MSKVCHLFSASRYFRVMKMHQKYPSPISVEHEPVHIRETIPVWLMEIFMGIPLQTFLFTAQLKRESELVLLFSEKPYTSIITTFTPFCYSDHTDGFFFIMCQWKKEWIPLREPHCPGEYEDIGQTFLSWASQNLWEPANPKSGSTGSLQRLGKDIFLP